MCLFRLLYKYRLNFMPMHREDHSTSWIAICLNINVLMMWLFVLSYTLILIPKRILWIIRGLERERVLIELAETEAHKRHEKILDMCSPRIGWGPFGTDEFMPYLDSKFKMMEDAGMFGDDDLVLHTQSWGYLEDDPFIGSMLASARKRERYWKNFFAEEFWDMLGKTPSCYVALEGYPQSLRRRLEKWKNTKTAAQDEKTEWILVDIE
ncbi:hypothetical protein VTL71DRAFT_14210 [Oculimacula yallundae]|uniref:Uncharacterized protein n=1 Tax=Oculimacula yallundae TaxID=86028 RepID=A0ABR4CJ66_9HELO